MFGYSRHLVVRINKSVLFVWKKFSGRFLVAAFLVVLFMYSINSPKRGSSVSGSIASSVSNNRLIVQKLNSSQESRNTLRKLHGEHNLGQIVRVEDVAHKREPHATEEVHHIGFLKVHKAASSTMQNMFFRFGLKRNLTFVFTTHPNYFSRTSGSHLPVIKPKYRSGNDILCNHGVFNYKLYSSVLPPDSTYIAIVRDPLDVFISGVNYYSQRSQAIGYIVKTPLPRIQNLIRQPEVYDKGFFTYTKNVMARDFGFQPSLDNNYTDQKLKELNDIFKIVLIVEYFEESLILMKRLLNWKLQDILYIPNNVYGKGESVKDLTPDDIRKFEKRNSLDYLVYNKFLDKFWAQFNAEPGDIHHEVSHFKQVLKYVLTFCSSNRAHDVDKLTIQQSIWNEQFEMAKEDCGLIKEDELRFISKLRKLQGSELPARRRVLGQIRLRRSDLIRV